MKFMLSMLGLVAGMVSIMSTWGETKLKLTNSFPNLGPDPCCGL